MSAAIRPPGSLAVPGARNRLLSALAVLAPDDAEWLERQLEPAEFESGEVLALAGTSFTQVYFPESAVVSVVSRMADGGAVEVGTVGNEGMASVSSFLDGGASACDTFVQIPGTIRCAPAAAVVDALDTRPAIRRLLNRYTQAYLTQVAQTAACNRLHHIEARCARWLLMTHDRVGGGRPVPANAGVPRHHARRAPGGRHRGRRRPPGRRAHPLSPRGHPGAGPAGPRVGGVRVLRHRAPTLRPAAALVRHLRPAGGMVLRTVCDTVRLRTVVVA
jgi:CRP-like cAMP-binding protein